MCAVSAVYDQYRDKPLDYWDMIKFEEFQKQITLAQEYDRINNQPDCGSEEKGRFIQEVKNKLTKDTNG